MKKLVLAVLLLSLSISLLIPVQAADENTIIAYKGTPVLDGVIDDMYKESGTSIVVDNSSSIYAQGTGKTDSKATSTTYILWDSNYIYYATEVIDPVLIDSGTKDWLTDAVEHRIVFDGETNDMNRHIAVDAFNTMLNTDRCDEDFIGAIKTATKVGEGSYVIELAIPSNGVWDGDFAKTEIQLGDILTADGASAAFWGNQNKFPYTIEFSGTEVASTVEVPEVVETEPVVVETEPVVTETEPAVAETESTVVETAPTETVTAPQTGDFGIIAAIALLCTSAVATIKSKKK